LTSLAAADLNSLLPHLRLVELPQETVLFEAGGEIDRVYFPRAGVVSLVVELASGEMIEAAMIGREGVVGDWPPSIAKSRSAGPSCKSPAPRR
jgi:CRP-like cAMP-binding protein